MSDIIRCHFTIGELESMLETQRIYRDIMDFMSKTPFYMPARKTDWDFPEGKLMSYIKNGEKMVKP